MFSSIVALAGAFGPPIVEAAVPGPINVNVVNAPARQPFSFTRSCVVGRTKACMIPKITVPADKTLVIENISFTGFNEWSSQAHAQLQVYPSPTTPSYIYIPAVLHSSGLNFASQPLRVYSTAGTQVSLTGIFIDASPSGGFPMTVSGYFVDCATEYLCGPQ